MPDEDLKCVSSWNSRQDTPDSDLTPGPSSQNNPFQGLYPTHNCVSIHCQV
jgi:hypothetical protein